MITSIFSKSKPINFIIVFFITLLAFVMARFGLETSWSNAYVVIEEGGLFMVCFASILLVNFIVNKNSLSKKSNYEILLFSLFLLTLTQTTNNVNILLSNFFVLLGLRRVISLRSKIELNKKLFDAAFWFAIAALFYFWAILFFVLILISLILYRDGELKHWVIPFTGVASVFVITMGASVVFFDDFFGAFTSFPEFSFNFNSYNSASYIIAITILLSFGIWSSLFYINSIKEKKKAFRVSFKTILVAAIIGFAIVFLAPVKDGSEFLFLFAPLAIIIANYIEIIDEKWFREIFLGVLIILPFVLLML
ncbi:DUF6427 family protein [Algibacter miyuki]|uniref:DUF6427 family protein n=1 Tax=Algibacter miyuki TaxID=1306933 RepID=A0ABV5GVC4_9FLAO|nr:DUF6427 family protein [Algibacter miyuki]MDN3664904.1 DUF6427 family protein [Algibacter miyuki]